MTRLIVNGDDFGMCEGVTLGILKAHKEGILRSTTMMVGMPFAAQAAQMAKDYPNLGLGIHFTLTAGKPVCDPREVPSLVEADGTFHSQGWHIENKAKPITEDQLNYEEVYKELCAQLDRFVELNGHMPDHVDSHHGSAFYPRIYEQTEKLIQEYELPTRTSGDHVITDYERPQFLNYFYDQNLSVEYFTNDHDHILEKDVCEIMSHPGFVDEYLYTHSSYNIQRTKELAILTDKRVLDWVKDNHIQLINFQDLKKLK